MTKTCKLFFSDCHISAGIGVQPSPGTFAWEWLSEADRQRLLSFLGWVKDRVVNKSNLPIIEEVVILGDLFDGWIFPHDIKPPTFEQIVLSTYAAPLVDLLHSLSSKVTISYCRGNHDMGMTSAIMDEWLPWIRFYNDPVMIINNTRAEHGHMYDLFNAPDYNKADSLPLGYFISRISATVARQTGKQGPSIEAEIRELAKVIEDKETVPQGVFDACCKIVGLKASDVIIMPDDLWGGETVSVGEISEMYKGLVGDWRKNKGDIQTDLAIAAALNDFELIADEMFLEGKAKTVIFGHTHVAKYVKHWIPFIKNWTYVNSGGWCMDLPKVSWVELIGDEPTLYKCSGFANGRSPVGLESPRSVVVQV
jgi:UDP-2,3-diacylglucosamine pyrophosphatase LpxH